MEFRQGDEASVQECIVRMKEDLFSPRNAEFIYYSLVETIH